MFIIIWLIRNRMLQDAEVFQSRLSKLDGFGDIGDHIVSVVKSKRVTGSSGSDATNATIDTTPNSPVSSPSATVAAATTTSPVNGSSTGPGTADGKDSVKADTEAAKKEVTDS
jgi:hypothetical protein